MVKAASRVATESSAASLRGNSRTSAASTFAMLRAVVGTRPLDAAPERRDELVRIRKPVPRSSPSSEPSPGRSPSFD
jgi:hypothetical protein